MTFYSILFEAPEYNVNDQAPDFFVDLNLDQIVDAIVAGRNEYNLKPFFFTSLNTTDAIKYRQEIMQELDKNNILYDAIKSFAQRMHIMREHLALSKKLHYKYEKEGWFLDAVEVYCKAINELVHDLASLDLKSRGFLAFREYLIKYTESEDFRLLFEDMKKVKEDLSTVKYTLLIKENQIIVRKYEGEVDYTAEVERKFEKFKHGAPKDYMVKFSDSPGMNHIETAVLDMVAQLYSDVFLNLDNFCQKYTDYLDNTIDNFDREIQFYLAYLEYVSQFRRKGLQFCYPHVSDKNKDVYSYEGFDLALATRLIRENLPIICNDFYLKGKERILVVTGPNQGGKTTFARTFGQLHYLASLGCLVPGREAQLFLFDRLFTCFETEENINNLSSKLEDDLIRIHTILEQATPNGIIIINELFSSSTLRDAIFLGKKVVEQIIRLDCLGVYVTFLEELASLEKTVSVVATVDPENPEVRTYKIVRRPAGGLAYAITIAKKYRLTYEQIKERIRP